LASGFQSVSPLALALKWVLDWESRSGSPSVLGSESALKLEFQSAWALESESRSVLGPEWASGSLSELGFQSPLGSA